MQLLPTAVGVIRPSFGPGDRVNQIHQKRVSAITVGHDHRTKLSTAMHEQMAAITCVTTTVSDVVDPASATPTNRPIPMPVNPHRW